MILGILGFIFSIMGVVGYFNEISALVIIAAIYVIIEAVIGLYTGELRNISTYVAAVGIGFFVAIFTKANILLTVAVALCFEELTLGIISVVFLVIIGIVKNKNKNIDNATEEDSAN